MKIRNTLDRVHKIKFQGRAANTGRMFVGLSDVSSTVNGWEIPIPVATKPTPLLELDLSPGSVPLNVFWVDSTVNGEIVDWVANLS